MRNEESNGHFSVPLSEIKVKDNVRVTYGENEMVELITSLKQHGQIQPVAVVPNADGDTKWELVAGNRRFAAARKLGWETIDAVVLYPTQEKRKRILNVVENLNRADVSLLEMGKYFAEMIEDEGYTVAELAAILSKSQDYVTSAMDAFQHVPKKFRKKIVHVVPGERKKGEGDIAGSNAKLALKLSNTYRLNKNQTSDLFDALEAGATKDDLRTVARLLNQGLTFEDSLAMAANTRVVNYSFVMPEENFQAIQQETGESLTTYIDALIKKDQRIGMIPIARNQGHKAPLRTAPKSMKMEQDEQPTEKRQTNVWTRKKQPKQETLELGRDE